MRAVSALCAKVRAPRAGSLYLSNFSGPRALPCGTAIAGAAGAPRPVRYRGPKSGRMTAIVWAAAASKLGHGKISAERTPR